MALSVSKLVAPPTRSIARELDEIYKDLHELDFISIEEPKGALERKESLQKEKQISVDPISLRESSMGEISFNMMLPPLKAPQDESAIPFPPPLLPAKHKFLSCSLPNSATSSPRFSSILSRKNLKNESQASPREIDKLVKKHSSAAQHHQEMQKSNQFWRSKSCGDGRTCPPPDEIDDFLLNKQHQVPNSSLMISNVNVNNENRRKSGTKHIESNEDDFKCGALCLFLPGFGKAKPVRPRKAEAAETIMMMENNNVISRTVSLEKFECGSWASSNIIPDHDEDGESVNLYFDLPLELIKNLGNDAHLPVSAAFVFDNKDIKGVLKNGSASGRATGRKSHESSRHVRFSTSSPTSYPASPASCITPRLRKARDDFNAFLEAQRA
ncbi:hypothetical protein CCACVL1_26822 [Corchorus capsularis]|uniref:Uncharacterized protein n=1 Tax=Corchorus capsularis TaxID=210143 RepID=A0A1R3GDC2_COCAP|nr:hypothetical protein CCACVL1_26822 [Corchorus capsularis]